MLKLHGAKRLLDLGASVAMTIASGALVWSLIDARSQNRVTPTQRQKPPLPSQPVSIKGAALEGSDHARIVLIEYSDFQCPFCGTFARETLPEIKRSYIDTNSVLLAFRHFPLDRLHPLARGAANAAACAAQQGRFWPMHDLLFAHQEQLDRSGLQNDATLAQLDLTKFETCQSGQPVQSVAEDLESGHALFVEATPTFLIGSIGSDRRVTVVDRFSGAVPLRRFEQTFNRIAAATAGDNGHL